LCCLSRPHCGSVDRPVSTGPMPRRGGHGRRSKPCPYPISRPSPVAAAGARRRPENRIVEERLHDHDGILAVARPGGVRPALLDAHAGGCRGGSIAAGGDDPVPRAALRTGWKPTSAGWRPSRGRRQRLRDAVISAARRAERSLGAVTRSPPDRLAATVVLRPRADPGSNLRSGKPAETRGSLLGDRIPGCVCPGHTGPARWPITTCAAPSGIAPPGRHALPGGGWPQGAEDRGGRGAGCHPAAPSRSFPADAPGW